METVHYLRTLFRQWWLILITLVAGGVGGYVVFAATVPTYTSSIQLIVANAGQDRLLANARAVALARISITPPAATDAIQAAGLLEAAPVITAVATAKDPFLTITVVDRTPALAQAIATAFASSLPATSLRLEGDAPPTETTALGPDGNVVITEVAPTPLALTIVTPANLPTKPSSPDPVRDIGLGLAAGLILGISIALLRDSLNRAVRDSEELERITGLVLLGTVPRDSAKKLMPVTTDPRGSRAEAYRQIRTSISNASTKASTTIVVTSATSGEGKTSVTTNVAAAFSRAGNRVAIIDADLRRPKVADYFGIDNTVGLTEVLSGTSTLSDALQIRDDGRLAVLTSGQVPANPSEALSGVLMEQVLQQLSKDYEFVFIDTPPVLPVTDALVLAPKVDAVVLVVRLGTTTGDRVKHAMAAISRVNANILGVVPNHAGQGTDREYQYRYRYSYATTSKKGAPDAVDIAPDLLQPSGTQAVLDRNDQNRRQPVTQNGRARLGAHRSSTLAALNGSADKVTFHQD